MEILLKNNIRICFCLRCGEWHGKTPGEGSFLLHPGIVDQLERLSPNACPILYFRARS